LTQIIGWSMWFSDYVFLERSWGKDERILQVRILQWMSHEFHIISVFLIYII
jgi:1-acyl-sn-glycerol-3-phosphate acyltransferase